MISYIESLASDNLPQDIQSYLPIAELNAIKNLALAETENGDAILGTLAKTKRSFSGISPIKHKWRQLRELAAKFSDQISPYSACKNGCSHCCNKSVMVTRSEARLIALCIGTPIDESVVTHGIKDKGELTSHHGIPCTFLIEGKCSIYQHRPLVCRMLVNMDSNELLCNLVPNTPVPVPYLNNSSFKMFVADLIGQKKLADLREWFPHGLQKS